GGFCAFEDPAGIDAALAIGFGKAGSVAHQTAGCRELAPFIDRRHRVASGQHDKLLAPAVEEWRGDDEERLANRGSKSLSALARTTTSLTPRRAAASCTSRNWLSAGE